MCEEDDGKPLQVTHMPAMSADESRKVGLAIRVRSVQLVGHLCAQANPYELHPISQKFPCHILSNSSNRGSFSSFQGRLLGTFSCYSSVHQLISGVMTLALCPQVGSQASQHFRSFCDT